MAPVKFFNFFALSSLAVLLSSLAPANALAFEKHLVSRHVNPAHAAIAKRGVVSPRRCKARNQKKNSTSSAAPKATPPPKKHSSSGGGGGSTYNGPVGVAGKKFGLGWALGNDPSLKFWKGASWMYTWSPYFPDNAKSLGIEPFAMLWGPKQEQDFYKLVKPGYTTTILGFNEPDQGGQSDMDPGAAAALWKKAIQPYAKKGLRLISPAVTSSPDGGKWMDSFMAQCTGCTFQGVAVHFYGTSISEFKTFLTNYHNRYKLPIWLTEYACQDFGPAHKQLSDPDVANFHREAIKFLDDSDFIAGYAPFGVMHDMYNVNPANRLMASGGQPNDLGKAYAG